jgi:hypothetical protein
MVEWQWPLGLETIRGEEGSGEELLSIRRFVQYI